MMIKKRFLLSLVFLWLLVLSNVAFVSAANIGVSPASITFQDVLRNGYAQRPILVTVDSDTPVNVLLTTWGEARDWLTVTGEDTSVSRGDPGRFMLSVNPPSDVANGNYTAFVRVNTSGTPSSREGYATGTIIPVLDLAVTIGITDREILECDASDFSVSSVEEGEEIIFMMKVLNTGNIRLRPSVVLDIWDQESVNLVRSHTLLGSEIIPTQEKDLSLRVSSKDLSLGQYWVDVSVLECFAERTLTFDVLEEGALRASGVLDQIVVRPWADIDEIVQIAVNFRNNGEKPLDARFVGKITKDAKIVQILESDQDLFVPIEGSDKFDFFFTPRDAGRYVVSGRVFYDGKRTYEQSAAFNVRPGNVIIDIIIKALIYLVLIVIIAVLLFKIRSERRAYFAKLKSKRY